MKEERREGSLRGKKLRGLKNVKRCLGQNCSFTVVQSHLDKKRFLAVSNSQLVLTKLFLVTKQMKNKVIERVYNRDATLFGKWK